MEQAIQIQFTVNGVQRRVFLEGWEKAIEVLRESLDLTGTKRGCDDASCGACTIVVDAEAVKACTYPAKRLDGKTVVTVEGMAEGGVLHPIQKALIEAGAVQCGFCIPGIVMKLYALFTKSPDASRDDVIEALSGHFCRCTGYEAILQGALLAQEYLRE